MKPIMVSAWMMMMMMMSSDVNNLIMSSYSDETLQQLKDWIIYPREGNLVLK